MQEKKTEVEILKEELKTRAEDYRALVTGYYWVNSGEKKEVFTIWEWIKDSKNACSRTGNIVAICFDRHSAIAVREGLRRMNENPYVQYEAQGRGRYGDEPHSV